MHTIIVVTNIADTMAMIDLSLPVIIVHFLLIVSCTQSPGALMQCCRELVTYYFIPKYSKVLTVACPHLLWLWHNIVGETLS